MKQTINLCLGLSLLFTLCCCFSCNEKQQVDAASLCDRFADNLHTDSFNYYNTQLVNANLSGGISRRYNYLLSTKLLDDGQIQKADSIIDKLIKEGCPEGCPYAVKAITFKENWYADTNLYNEVLKLEKIYTDKKLTSSLIELYSVKGYMLSNQGKLILADTAFNKADYYYEKYGTTNAGLFYFYQRGNAYQMQGKFRKAKEFFLKKLDLAKQGGRMSDINSTKLDLTAAQSSLHQYQEVIQTCFELMSYYEENEPNSPMLSFVYNNIAITHLKLSDYQKAKKYFFKMLEVVEKSTYSDIKSMAYGPCLYNISRNYYHLENQDSAIIFALKALSEFTQQENIFYIITCQNHLGSIYFSLGQNKKAEKYYKEALKHNIDMEGTRQQMDIYSGYGSLLLNKGEISKGINLLRSAIKIAEEESDVASLSDFHGTLRSYYASTKDYKNAHLASEKHLKYRDSLQEIHNFEALNNEKLKYENEKEKIKNELQVKNMKIEHAMKNKNAQFKLLVLLIVAVLLFSIAIFYRKIFLQKKKSESIIKSKNDELGSLINELEESNSNLSNFAQMAAHDIRSPLTSIKSFTYLLMNSEIDIHEDKYNKYLNQISESTDRMSDMISGLLTLSELKREVSMEKVDLNSILIELKEQLSMEFSQVDGTLDIDPALPQVMASESLVRVVFQNLLNNAIKYKKDDTQLHIKVTLNKAKSTTELCTINVVDNGKGIKETHIQNIFDMYNKNSSDKESFGIGLSTCKRIITKLGGNISVSSTRDEGSCFSISLLKI